MAATAHASSRPPFPRTVSGTIGGSWSTKTDSESINASWTISGARFKLVHVRSVEGSWTGFYKVTGGTVKFSMSESGRCSYSLSDTFALKPSMPKNNPSTPLALIRNLVGKDSYDGTIEPNKHWKVTETCTDPNAQPTTSTLTIDAPNLFNTGEKRGRIGAAMKGRYVIRDDYTHRTSTYTWSLKP